jgi:hypothetical protein
MDKPIPNVAVALTIRDITETPCNASIPLKDASRELAIATITNGKSERKDFGSGLVKKRGITIRINKTISGYRDNGRTRVPPPTFPGKNGKLVTGRVTKKSTHAILERVEANFTPLVDHQRFIFDTRYA